MAIVGVLETGMFFGTVNTTATAPAVSGSNQHNFTNPVNLWSRPYIQSFSNHDSDGAVSTGISAFINDAGAFSVDFHPGVFVNNCTSVTFGMFTIDCIAEMVCTTEIFE